MNQEILALCRSLGVGEGEEELLLPLIQAAVGELTGRLKAGTAPGDCGSAFPLAAAMLAADALEGATGGRRVDSFTAGEVSVRMSGGGRGLRAQAERLMEPWLRERGFAFQGVRG